MIDAIVYSSLSGSCEEYAHRMSAALHVPFFTEQSHICPIGRKVVYIRSEEHTSELQSRE